MNTMIYMARPASQTSGRTAATSLHAFSGTVVYTTTTASMYGFRKRHGERRLNYGL